MTRRTIYSAILLMVTSVLAALVPAYAQEPMPQTVEVDIIMADLGEQNQYMHENGAVESFDFYLPSSIIPKPNSYLDLVLSYKTFGSERPGELRIDLNDVNLGVLPLTESLVEKGHLTLDVADALEVPGRNRLVFTLDTKERCGYPQPAIDVTVHNDTRLHLVYDIPPFEPDLSRYPWPFVERSFKPDEVYVVLPQEPTTTDLMAAATVSAGLGKAASSTADLVITSTLAISLPDEVKTGYNLIVIGKPEDNALLGELELPFDWKAAGVPETYGIIQEMASLWNPYQGILVVTGSSDEGLRLASEALNRETHFPGMKGQVAVVEDVLPRVEEKEQYDIDVSFAEMGSRDEILYGIGQREVNYYFWMPRAWVMAENPRLYLFFDYSRILDPNLSSITVELGDTPLESVLLTPENTLKGSVEVELPANRLRSGTNKLTVSVAMHLVNEDPCLDLHNRQAWVVIRNDSYLHLAYVPQQVPFDLSLFAYPFSENPNYDDLYFVLPTTNTQIERDSLLRLAAIMGASTRGKYLTMQGITADDRRLDEIKNGYNMIVIGQPSRNPLLQELNDWLPQPFQEGSDKIRPELDLVIFADVFDRSVGLLQELPSPWNPRWTIAVITGTSDEGVGWAYQTLIEGPEGLHGNLAATDEEGLIHAVDTRPREAEELTSAGVEIIPETTVQESRLLLLAERWWGVR
jgi:hypothetical protein